MTVEAENHLLFPFLVRVSAFCIASAPLPPLRVACAVLRVCMFGAPCPVWYESGLVSYESGLVCMGLVWSGLYGFSLVLSGLVWSV
uniref:Uncharacterized protein n=1 Tax=Picea sitchensis TaxID=3332 RepID=D5ACD0_PICSI|nr:unknown [Picea sitchensis]